MRQRDDGPAQGRVFRVGCDVAHKAFIDLKLVDMEMFKVSKRGKARAEVVDG